MDPERFGRLKEIVLTAAALPPEERSAYLDRTCSGDESLRSEVEGLLEHDRTASALSHTAAMGQLVSALRESASSQTNRRLPDRIGPYRILGLLGEGGMGTVYHAEQMEPIRREVALKLIRHGADSAAVLARFEAERQTLAQMDHPNIARVLDAGSDEDRPYFVMELVHGVSITSYCQAERLNSRGRLRLFLDVCRAVSHAHRKGVIHRDLKPSNILVTVARGGPVPKVIDFSIARSLSESMIGTEFRTRTGQIIGTLEYMSPEQARGEIASIDVRSDIYSLGVVAYELLSDRLPYKTREQPLHEAVRRITEDSPESLRATSATTTGADRVDTDVETIVGKCLEKDPERRYGSVGELVEDLERYFDSRPILARTPSKTYQLRKLVGRHRVAFGVASLVFLLLLAFTATTWVQLGAQRRERARAETAAQRAQEESRKSDRVVAFMTELLGSAVPSEVGREATILEALEYVRPAIEKELADEPQVAAAVLEVTGAVYRDLGMHERSEAAQNEALELRLEHLGPSHPDVAASFLELARLRFYQARLDDAERLARQALEIYDNQESPDPSSLASVFNTLGLTLRRAGRLAEAEPVLVRAVEYSRRIQNQTRRTRGYTANTLESLAGVWRRLGRYAEAEAVMREVVVVKRESNPGGSGTSTALYNHAAVLMLLGRYQEAETVFRSCLEIEEKLFGRDNPVTLVTVTQLAEVQLFLGRYIEAERLVREATVIHRVAPERFRKRLAADLAVLARVLAAAGDPAAAEAAGREAVAVAEAALGADHLVTANALIALARGLDAGGRWNEAEETLSEAERVLREQTSDDNPQVGSVLAARARALRKLDRTEEALGLARESLATAERTLGDSHPHVAAAANEVAEALAILGEPEEAARHARVALGIWRNGEFTDPSLIRRAETLADVR